MSTHLKLYLDDNRPCPEGWVAAKTVHEAKWQIAWHIAERHEEGYTNTFEVSLDHDLGRDANGHEEPNGTALVNWLRTSRLYPTNARIHSDNPVGRKNLAFDLAGMWKDAEGV